MYEETKIMLMQRKLKQLENICEQPLHILNRHNLSNKYYEQFYEPSSGIVIDENVQGTSRIKMKWKPAEG